MSLLYSKTLLQVTPLLQIVIALLGNMDATIDHLEQAAVLEYLMLKHMKLLWRLRLGESTMEVIFNENISQPFLSALFIILSVAMACWALYDAKKSLSQLTIIEAVG